jgi:hypothetical protein
MGFLVVSFSPLPEACGRNPLDNLTARLLDPRLMPNVAAMANTMEEMKSRTE